MPFDLSLPVASALAHVGRALGPQADTVTVTLTGIPGGVRLDLIEAQVPGTGAGTAAVGALIGFCRARQLALVVGPVEPHAEGFWRRFGDLRYDGCVRDGRSLYRLARSQNA